MRSLLPCGILREIAKLFYAIQVLMRFFPRCFCWFKQIVSHGFVTKTILTAFPAPMERSMSEKQT